MIKPLTDVSQVVTEIQQVLGEHESREDAEKGCKKDHTCSVNVAIVSQYTL